MFSVSVLKMGLRSDVQSVMLTQPQGLYPETRVRALSFRSKADVCLGSLGKQTLAPKPTRLPSAHVTPDCSRGCAKPWPQSLLTHPLPLPKGRSRQCEGMAARCSRTIPVTPRDVRCVN